MEEDELRLRGIPTLGLDIIVMDELKKGSVVSSPDDGDNSDTIQYDIKSMRECMVDLYKAYSVNASKKEMCDILDKHRKRADDEIHNFLSRIENVKEDKMFKVIDKTVKNGEITIKFKEIPKDDKIKVVKSIVKKLANKVSKEQLKIMFEQSIMKLNDIAELKSVDKALDKKNIEIEEKRGCFKLVVDDHDLFIIG